jgi:GNAT superfamily N-acetyltransferase
MSQSFDDGLRSRQGARPQELTGAPQEERDLQYALAKEIITAANLEDAMTVIKKCFSLEGDISAARSAYQRFISGEHVYDSEFSGTRVELVSYSLYRIGGQPAAVWGAYRLLNEPDRLYMGWLGVSPEFRKNRIPDITPLSEVILEDTIALALQRGATTIAAVAEDAQANHNTHRYYERLGFQVERVFERNGETDRLYVLKIAPRLPTQEAY